MLILQYTNDGDACEEMLKDNDKVISAMKDETDLTISLSKYAIFYMPSSVRLLIGDNQDNIYGYVYYPDRSQVYIQYENDEPVKYETFVKLFMHYNRPFYGKKYVAKFFNDLRLIGESPLEFASNIIKKIGSCDRAEDYINIYPKVAEILSDLDIKYEDIINVSKYISVYVQQQRIISITPSMMVADINSYDALLSMLIIDLAVVWDKLAMKYSIDREV